MAGLIFVLVSTLLAVGGMLIVRKRVGVKAPASYHEVAGYLLSVIGTLYAVLLGFVVVDAMGKQQELRVIVEQEASGVANIFLCSHGLPDPMRKRIQVLCREYVVDVVNDEWDCMRGTYSPRAFAGARSLRKESTSKTTDNEQDETIRGRMLEEMCQMTDKRRTRLVTTQLGVAPIMWAVLIVGGVFTVLFTYFFGVENLRAQIIMTVLVATTLSLNVFLVFVFAYPLAGDVAVRPDAFQMDLLIFDFHEKGSIPPNLPLPMK